MMVVSSGHPASWWARPPLAITRSRNTSSPSASNPKICIHPGQHVIQQALNAVYSVRARGTTGRGPGAGSPPNNAGCPGPGPSRPAWPWSDPEIEHALPVVLEQAPGLLHEQSELSLVASRTHMPHDPAPARHRLRDLHSRRPRCRTHPPDPSHQQSLRAGLVP